MNNHSFSLSISNLSFSYGRQPIFFDFTLKTNANVVVLRGPSGCGKTTLLKILYGYLQPDSKSCVEHADNVCLLLQEDGLFPWLSGRDNIFLDSTITEDALSKHPLFSLVKDFVKQKVCTLSYGQRRKIELMRAFLGDFRALYLDEPFNYIDPSSRKILAEYIDNGMQSKPLIVMTTHYESDVEGIRNDTIIFNGELPITGVFTPHKPLGIQP